MPLPAAIHAFGSTDLELGENPRIVRRSDGFDEGAFLFQGGTQDSLPPDEEVPGYSGMFVVENQTTDSSGDFEHDIRAVGLRSGQKRIISSTAVDAEEGFDTGAESIILALGQKIKYGDPHSEYKKLIAVSAVEKRSPVKQYKIFDVLYKGIKSGTRPIKRTISANVEISVIDDLVLIGAGGDSTTAHKWAIAWPKVTVTFSYLRENVELKPMPQQGGSPAGPLPTVKLALESLPSDADLTYNWPNNWRLDAMPMEELPGTKIAFVQEIWVWQQKVTV